MVGNALSKSDIVIRLPAERWMHITEEHPELAGLWLEVLETIENAERILEGTFGAKLAYREYQQGKFLVVVYRELETDGFVITAFLTRRTDYLDKRKQLWP